MDRWSDTTSHELRIGGVPLTRLAHRVGRTPFYAYDRALLTMRIDELRAALPRSLHIHYAVKANPMPALVSHVGARVDGLDVASGAELRVALDAGVSARHISFAGPGKTEPELMQAVAAGVLLNVESLREIRAVADVCDRIGYPARVALRINPDFQLKSAGLRMGGGPSQFGIDAEEVPAALSEVRTLGLSFEGFHIFAGSQNLDAGAICKAQSHALDMAVRLAASAPSPVTVLNLGGGLGIPYSPTDRSLDLEAIGRHLDSITDVAMRQIPQAQLVIELGRFLVGEAGFYVCRILDRKRSRGRLFLVTDGGLHQHLAATGNLGQVIRRNYPVGIGNRMLSANSENVTVVGSLCTPLDILADRVDLPCTEAGDFFVIFQSGAYGLTASPHRFLSHPDPLEVLV